MTEQLRIIDKMQGRSVMVVGDMVADVYIDGRISRISREAPVLVLENHGEKIVAGGAANVANNIATLGGMAYAVGLVGNDEHAKHLREILTANGARVTGIISDPERFTISKTRVVASGRATVSQQIVRIDRESTEPVSRFTEKRIIRYIGQILSKMDGIVLSDYGAGTITNNLGQYVIERARRVHKPVIVDSRYDVRRFKGVNYIKQNDAELAAAMERTFANEEDLQGAGFELLREMEADGLLITRGEKGMTLLLNGGGVFNIPVADKSEVYDVSGAGDTCVATVIMALAAHIAPEHAAALSNIASGIAVRKLGTATVTQEELRRAVERS